MTAAFSNEELADLIESEVTTAANGGWAVVHVDAAVLLSAVAALREHTPAPGPCWHDSGMADWRIGVFDDQGPTIRCDLDAGHAGAHVADRSVAGGTAVWPNEPDPVIARRLCEPSTGVTL